jgi:hypothetical protein
MRSARARLPSALLVAETGDLHTARSRKIYNTAAFSRVFMSEALRRTRFGDQPLNRPRLRRIAVTPRATKPTPISVHVVGSGAPWKPSTNA